MYSFLAVNFFAFSMNSNTALVANSSSCVSHAVRSNGACHVPFGGTSFNPYGGCTFNRKQRRALEQQHKKKHFSFEERAQRASEAIDNYLEVNESSYFSGWLVRWATGSNHADFMTSDQITKELAFINTLTNNVLKNSKLLPLIMHENSYVRQVVEALPNKLMEEWDYVKGSEVDRFLDPTSMFPEIAHDKAVKFFDYIIQDCKDALSINLEIMDMIERSIGRMVGIHNVLLVGHKHSIKPMSLRISENGRYLSSTDTSEKRIIWDMVTAKIVDDYNMTRSLKWDIGETKSRVLNEPYSPEADWVLSKDKNYFAMSGVFHGDVRDERLIYLYVRPTLAFRLCELAINNSKGNSNELRKLRASKMLNSVKGFHKDKLIEAIEILLQNLSDRK